MFDGARGGRTEDDGKVVSVLRRQPAEQVGGAGGERVDPVRQRCVLLLRRILTASQGEPGL